EPLRGQRSGRAGKAACGIRARGGAVPAAPQTRSRGKGEQHMKTERVYTRSATYQKFEVLKTNRNKRYKYGEFFVEGVRNINNAVENGWEIVSFLYDGDRKLSDWARDKL